MKFLREFESQIKYDEYLAMSGNPWPVISSVANVQNSLSYDEELKDADAIIQWDSISSQYLGGNGSASRETTIRRDTKSIYGNDRHYGVLFSGNYASGNTVPASRFGVWEQYSFYDRMKEKFDNNIVAYKFNKVGGVEMLPDCEFGWMYHSYNKKIRNLKLREGLKKIGGYSLRNNSYQCNLIFPDSVTGFGSLTLARQNYFLTDACLVWGEGTKNFGSSFFDYSPIPAIYYVCKAIVPPTGSSPFGSFTFSSSANEKYKYIFVPKESLVAYQTTTNAFTATTGAGKTFLGFKTIEDDLPSSVNINQEWMPDGALPK